MDFSNYLFRASQSYYLMVGNIGLSPSQKVELEGYLARKIGALEGGNDENGKPYKKLTTNMEQKVIELLEIKKNKELPKTMKTELRKIYRAERFKRNFSFTNKYVQKGIQQEEDGVTVYQDFRNKVRKIRTYFKTGVGTKIRLNNEWFTGEPDLVDTNDFKNCKEGFDIKCAWELDTFPFDEDELVLQYQSQNQVYMNLTGAGKWTTATVLVNTTEHLLNNEKLKWYYAIQMHNDAEWTDEKREQMETVYKDKCIELEVKLIFDYDKFVSDNPGHLLEISKKEWFANGYDIPLVNRVIEKVVFKDEDFINKLKERVIVSRKYLQKLWDDDHKKVA
jgi:hypothetical protein